MQGAGDAPVLDAALVQRPAAMGATVGERPDLPLPQDEQDVDPGDLPADRDALAQRVGGPGIGPVVEASGRSAVASTPTAFA